MCAHVYVHVRMCMYMYVYVCTHLMHVCACACTCTYVYVHVRMRMYMYVHVCTHQFNTERFSSSYVCVCTCMYVHVHVCICMYTPIQCGDFHRHMHGICVEILIVTCMSYVYLHTNSTRRFSSSFIFFFCAADSAISSPWKFVFVGTPNTDIKDTHMSVLTCVSLYGCKGALQW